MENIIIRKAQDEDIDIIFDLIMGLAIYERRPQDMTATKEQLSYWLFDKKIATTLIAEQDGNVIGYTIYYPIFGSFSAKGKVHLEDLYIKPEFRGKGFGKYFFNEIVKFVKQDGYLGMEWSCLDWNESAIKFYNKINAEIETGRVYFNFKMD